MVPEVLNESERIVRLTRIALEFMRCCELSGEVGADHLIVLTALTESESLLRALAISTHRHESDDIKKAQNDDLVFMAEYRRNIREAHHRSNGS